MITYVLMALLIITAPGKSKQDFSQWNDPLTKECIICVGKQLEILDEYDQLFSKYYESDDKNENFNNAVEEIRDTWKELKDAPPSQMAYNFFPVWELRYFNQLHEGWLTSTEILYPYKADYIEDWRNENNKILSIYNYIAATQNPNNGVTFRRTYLKAVRKLIGEKAFYEGRLPYTAPVWRFSVIRID